MSVLSKMSKVFIIFFFFFLVNDSITKSSLESIIIVWVKRWKSKTLRTWLHMLKKNPRQIFHRYFIPKYIFGEFNGSSSFLYFFSDHVLQTLVIYRQYFALDPHHKAMSQKKEIGFKQSQTHKAFLKKWSCFCFGGFCFVWFCLVCWFFWDFFVICSSKRCVCQAFNPTFNHFVPSKVLL